MQELASVKLIIRNSQFFAHLYKLEKSDEVIEIIKSHRRSYKKANHHCYALYISAIPNSQITESFRDDREVGHPGKVLLEILKKKQSKPTYTGSITNIWWNKTRYWWCF